MTNLSLSRYIDDNKSKDYYDCQWVVHWIRPTFAFTLQTTENTTYFNNQSSVVIVFCADVGIPDDHRLVFAVYQLVVMFAAPLLVMAYCYSRVIHALWISTKDLRNLTEKKLV